MAPAAGQTSSPASAKTSAKGSKKNRIIVLRLSPKQLARLTPETLSETKPSRANSSTSSVEAPATKIESSAADAASDSNATPVPTTIAPAGDNNNLAPPPNGAKKRGIPGPKPGAKRGAGLMLDGQPKPRGKPGPKKKPRLPDGTIDHGSTATAGAFGGIAPIAAHKLGPKANQGAINAGLRALDRSGKPCRKWQRNEFKLKSFTGVTWAVRTWRSPKNPSNLTPSESSSEATSANDLKPKFDENAIASERSNGPIDITNIHTGSSPMPIEAA
ncbi:MAG: hypothetical protein M1820_008853 [Bogoriella megaspora]|nr:MAG: hypothetical protein M1820_008853 [Bogoriella megaspora]